MTSRSVNVKGLARREGKRERTSRESDDAFEATFDRSLRHRASIGERARQTRAMTGACAYLVEVAAGLSGEGASCEEVQEREGFGGVEISSESSESQSTSSSTAARTVTGAARGDQGRVGSGE